MDDLIQIEDLTSTIRSNPDQGPIGLNHLIFTTILNITKINECIHMSLIVVQS